MRYPDFLKKNGTIGFVAPSFGCNIEPYKTAFQHSLAVWAERGFRTQLGPNVYKGEGLGISNTPEKCGQELMDLYLSEENDVLISCGGGELMCEDLEFVDFDRLRQATPKWFMGYSDNTNLTFLLATLCDTAAVYGPCAPAFGMQPWHLALEDALGVLTGTLMQENAARPAGNTEECISEGRQYVHRREGTADNAEKGVPEPLILQSPAGTFLQSEWPVLTVYGYDRYEVEGKKDEEHPLEPYNVTQPCVRKCFLSFKENGKTVMKEAVWDGRPAGSDSAGSSACSSGAAGFLPAMQTEPVTFSGRLLGGCLDILVMLLGTKYDKVRAFNERYKEDGIIWFIEACDLNVMSIRRAVWQMKNAGWFEHVKGILVGRPYNGEAFLGLDEYHAVTDLLADLHVPVLMDLDIGHVPPMMPLVLGSRATVSAKENDLRIDMELRP